MQGAVPVSTQQCAPTAQSSSTLTTLNPQIHISCSGRALCRPRTNLRTNPTSYHHPTK